MAAVAAMLKNFDLSVEDIFKMDRAELASFGFLTSPMLDRLEDKSLDDAARLRDTCQDQGVQLLCFDDERYPDRLRNIFDPPAVLYYRGTLPDFCTKPCFGIVGTRKASSHGLACAQELAQRLCNAGGIIISGGAAGIDQAAHQGAVTAKGETVAVLGCGVDFPYYPSGRDLRKLIEKYGAALSEFPPGTPAIAYNFPVRNRIISGLSLCISVIEGAAKSGSVITANIAAEQGREVFALPGFVGLANSEATNALLRDGAVPLTTPNDIIKEYISLYPNSLRLEKHEAPLGSPDRRRVELPGGIVEEDIEIDKQREKESAAPSRAKTKKAAKSAAKETEQIQSHLPDLSGISAAARSVFEALGEESLSSEELAERAGLELSGVLVSLTELELSGAIISLPGMRYKKA